MLRGFSVHGETFLYKLITSMIYVPSIAHDAGTNFSETEYKRTVIEVLQQLLEGSATSRVNMGTYISLLEASETMVQNVAKEQGLNNRLHPSLSQAAIKLQSILHRKLMSGVAALGQHGAHISACNILLSPDPVEAGRRVNSF